MSTTPAILYIFSSDRMDEIWVQKKSRSANTFYKYVCAYISECQLQLSRPNAMLRSFDIFVHFEESGCSETNSTKQFFYWFGSNVCEREESIKRVSFN